MNVAQWLERSAKAFAGRPALAFGASACATYAQLRERAGRLADGLRRMGARPGDRIALFAANHPDYLEAMWAAWIAGLVAVPVNAKLHPREAAYILADCGAFGCWVDEEREGMAPGGCPQWRLDAIDALRGP